MSESGYVEGPPDLHVLRRGEAAYESLSSGFNVAVAHDPDVVVDAAGADDVVAAIELAARDDLPVAVMNTGHGPSLAIDRGVLIRTGRMNRVAVDPSSARHGSRAGLVARRDRGDGAARARAAQRVEPACRRGGLHARRRRRAARPAIRVRGRPCAIARRGHRRRTPPARDGRLGCGPLLGPARRRRESRGRHGDGDRPLPGGDAPRR